jgi:hypothetical protein
LQQERLELSSSNFIPDEEAKEIMLSWEHDSPVITDSVLWWEEYLDKVARRITVATVPVIQ